MINYNRTAPSEKSRERIMQPGIQSDPGHVVGKELINL